MARRSVLVVTVVHHPEDSRIRQRQISALVSAGWRVTYAAPFTGFGVPVPGPLADRRSAGSLRCVDLRRAAGRRRLGAWRAARGLLRALGPRHDLVLVHDPELLLAAAGLGLTHLVWDVHEDPAAALGVKEWMPKPLRPPAASAWRAVERSAERRYRLLLSEYSYQRRFRSHHPVVPNAVRVPRLLAPTEATRICYLGSVTMSRGCQTMIEVAAQLARRTDGAIRVEVIGPAPDPRAAEALRRAARTDGLTWTGFLRSDEALARVSGSLAGLCLLQDLPNFRHSLPTKIIEYGAVGVPAITTPLPLAANLVRSAQSGLVVPFDDAPAVVDAVLRLRDDPRLAARLGSNGHARALRDHDWAAGALDFVALMEGLAAGSDARTTSRTRRARRLHLVRP